MTTTAKKMRLGALETPGFTLAPAFFEPLPDDTLRLWNDGSEDPVDISTPNTPLNPLSPRRIW